VRGKKVLFKRTHNAHHALTVIPGLLELIVRMAKALAGRATIRVKARARFIISIERERGFFVNTRGGVNNVKNL
jgi:hypothetical protein